MSAHEQLPLSVEQCRRILLWVQAGLQMVAIGALLYALWQLHYAMRGIAALLN